LRAEKDDFLRQARAALKRKQEAEAQAAAAAAERERQQQEFEQNAARGHYRKELALALTQYQKKLAIVSETEQAVAAARAERSKLECDVTTSVEKLQGLLARNADLLAVLTTRLTAHQDKANSHKAALNNAIQDARRELVRKWQTVRQPVLEKAARAVSALFSLSDHDVKDVANHSRLIYDIDHAVGFPRGYVNSVDWPYTEDPVTLAEDIERRFVGLETYLASPLYSNRLEVISHVTG
jgi:uncharacterized protein YjiS (DUF1127 family)